jgi:hypothetical protein
VCGLSSQIELRFRELRLPLSFAHYRAPDGGIISADEPPIVRVIISALIPRRGIMAMLKIEMAPIMIPLLLAATLTSELTLS